MKLSWRYPFNDKGGFQDWVNNLRKSNGVYLIRGGGVLRYIGESHSSCLAATLKRHFSAWKDDRTRKHFVCSRDKSVRVAVVKMPPTVTVAAQNRMIQRLKPSFNTEGFGDEPPF